jgi:hypothetical protein
VGGSAPAAVLAPLLIGPVVFLFLAGVVIALDPPGALEATQAAGSDEGLSETYPPRPRARW